MEAPLLGGVLIFPRDLLILLILPLLFLPTPNPQSSGLSGFRAEMQAWGGRGSGGPSLLHSRP